MPGQKYTPRSLSGRLSQRLSRSLSRSLLSPAVFSYVLCSLMIMCTPFARLADVHVYPTLAWHPN